MIGKLDRDIEKKQFNEKLPRIQDHLLKREQDMKELVTTILNHQSYLETLKRVCTARNNSKSRTKTTY